MKLLQATQSKKQIENMKPWLHINIYNETSTSNPKQDINRNHEANRDHVSQSIQATAK